MNKFGTHLNSGPVIEPGYRLLEPGERALPNDEAWTWNSPQCTELGWVSVGSMVGVVAGQYVVPIRRHIWRVDHSPEADAHAQAVVEALGMPNVLKGDT